MSENNGELSTKKNKKKIILIIVAVIIGLCLLCLVFGLFLQGLEAVGLRATRTPVPTATNTPEPSPTNTPEPTHTFTPTFTLEPTLTFTPEATPTLEPTPTPEPEPIILSGSGDDVVDFDNPFNIAIVKITGNSAGRYFGVKNYGSDGTNYNLLVNTTDPYEGIRPLDFYDNEHTTRFEITAVGEWKIEILPITEARILNVPGEIEGFGDDIILLTGSEPDIATIKGNSSSRYFGVFGYHARRDLLVNTTDPYEGRVSVNRNTLILEIISVDDWSIVIE